MIDISNAINTDDIPLCPLCEQPIMNYETVAIVTAAAGTSTWPRATRVASTFPMVPTRKRMPGT